MSLNLTKEGRLVAEKVYKRMIIGDSKGNIHLDGLTINRGELRPYFKALTYDAPREVDRTVRDIIAVGGNKGMVKKEVKKTIEILASPQGTPIIMAEVRSPGSILKPNHG